MVRYAITDGRHEAGSDRLLSNAHRWCAEDVDYVQLREKHLNAGELARLAKAIGEVFAQCGGGTKLLVNHRVDVAIATGAGVHLTSAAGELTPVQVRQAFAWSGRQPPVISVSCHSVEEVVRAVAAGADLVLFGPVFGKQVHRETVAEGLGLEALAQACVAANGTPVLALGGVTVADTEGCVVVGAVGIAGIRLFL